jgi:hypothetical protein
MGGFKTLREAKGFHIRAISPIFFRNQRMFTTRGFPRNDIPFASFANGFRQAASRLFI